MLGEAGKDSALITGIRLNFGHTGDPWEMVQNTATPLRGEESRLLILCLRHVTPNSYVKPQPQCGYMKS
jgi:hypothetical protein